MLELTSDFIQNIDWELLKKQKQTLLEVIATYNVDIANNSISNNLNGIIKLIDSIIELIDSIQDNTVDFCELDENDVYDFN